MDATYMELMVRLTLAMVLGGAIGIEREYRAKEAGFRTHFLVALGSALFCVVSQYGFGVDLKDSSRVAAQVVSGIGFLGAGTIIFQKNVVRGLTTAAGLWVTAAIGLACGTGMFVAAVITTAMVPSTALSIRPKRSRPGMPKPMRYRVTIMGMPRMMVV